MRSNKLICAECQKDSVPRGGYLMNQSVSSGILSMYIASTNSDFDIDSFEKYLCGKECLIQHLNKETDKLGGDAETSAALSPSRNGRERVEA